MALLLQGGMHMGGYSRHDNIDMYACMRWAMHVDIERGMHITTSTVWWNTIPRYVICSIPVEIRLVPSIAHVG